MVTLIFKGHVSLFFVNLIWKKFLQGSCCMILWIVHVLYKGLFYKMHVQMNSRCVFQLIIDLSFVMKFFFLQNLTIDYIIKKFWNKFELTDGGDVSSECDWHWICDFYHGAVGGLWSWMSDVWLPAQWQRLSVH